MNLKPFFHFDIKSIERFNRNDADAVVNLVLTSKDNQKFFLKEVQAHSMREGLDEVYQHLHSVKANLSNWILPLPCHDDSAKFLFEIDGKSYLLFPFVTYLPFSQSKLSLENLWESIEEFHQLIKNKKFAKQDYRNYQSWMEMGSTRLKKKFGNELPFLSSFDEFMQTRFSQIQFQTGPIHWDIYEDNVGFDCNGKLVLLDFDLVQEGTYTQDLVAAAAMYVDWGKPIEESFLFEVYQKIIPFSVGLKKEDVKFLLGRNILGDLALEDSKEKVVAQLEYLNNVNN